MLERQLPPNFGIDPLLTENDVCAVTRMSLRTLQRKRKAGLIHGIAWNARRYRYKKSEVERFIQAAEKATVVRFGGDKKETAKAPEQVSPSGLACAVNLAPKHPTRRHKPKT